MVVLVAVTAAAVRIIPVLRGAGLYGRISYDGSVYYGAAAALSRGLTPYRDFLLLHPPGIMLALLPFAALGQLRGDAEGLAVARVAFMLLGAVNAVLLSRILRPHGRWAAAAGGLFYAVFFPAVFMERSISLEAAATLCTLAALWLLLRPRLGTLPGTSSLLLAGMLLGFGAGLKIWGVVVAAAVVAWCLRSLGVRSAVLTGCGAALGVGLVCGPFFVAAPREMWRMVVLDQLGRPPSPKSLAVRVKDILGVAGPGDLPLPTVPLPVVVAALVLAVLAVVLAFTTRTGRVAVVVLTSCVALLLLTPSWFAHYAGLAAAPAALVVGAAASRVVEHANRQWTIALVGVLAATSLVWSVGIGVTRTFGSPFPGRQLAAAAAASPGCVTADDVTALIESNLLGRNFSRHCPVVVDLGGYSYDLSARESSLVRSHNRTWQSYAIRYLSSGELTVIGRFHKKYGFSSSTASVVSRWPELARGSGFHLRRPS